MTVKLPNFPIHVSEVEEQTKEVPTKPVVEVPFPNLPSSISNSLALAEIPIHVFRSKLPSHLFERCTWTSFFYLLHDLVLVSFTFYLATWIDPLTRYYQWSKIANWTLWFFYAIFQGIFCTGLWVQLFDFILSHSLFWLHHASRLCILFEMIYFIYTFHHGLNHNVKLRVSFFFFFSLPPFLKKTQPCIYLVFLWNT
ncbi:Delta(12)-fatty-acid desaturase [Coelomomyces lativittatus]|nr:Delta(12)-fatty-acid desaturase [Coelomomyces lativittatus]